MWYRTLDQMFEHKAQIEHALFMRLRICSRCKSMWYFMRLTSTYFEGNGPPELGAHGYSRDSKPRDPQILVGLVMVDGWPIAHQDAYYRSQLGCALRSRAGIGPQQVVSGIQGVRGCRLPRRTDRERTVPGFVRLLCAVRSGFSGSSRSLQARKMQ
jgi:hypothetical protein